MSNVKKKKKGEKGQRNTLKQRLGSRVDSQQATFDAEATKYDPCLQSSPCYSKTRSLYVRMLLATRPSTSLRRASVFPIGGLVENTDGLVNRYEAGLSEENGTKWLHQYTESIR